MRMFNLDKVNTVICDTKDTRNGFKHEAVLLQNGYERGKAKICYLNRTWEGFQYESVLLRLIDTYFENEEHKKYVDIIKQIKY